MSADGPYPNCSIAPGKGCAACEDIERDIERDIRDMWHVWRIGTVVVLGLFVAVLVVLTLSAA